MKTELQIIEETAIYYSEDVNRRAKEETDKGAVVCQYITKDGRMCAFGRCLEEPENFVADNWSAEHILSDYGLDVLKPEYRVGDRDFWQNLQSFHDTDFNWGEKGLSNLGQYELDKLKKRYDN